MRAHFGLPSVEAGIYFITDDVQQTLHGTFRLVARTRSMLKLRYTVKFTY
jgi:hypothetical protein